VAGPSSNRSATHAGGVSNQQRRPQGTPTGGQFAGAGHAESGVALAPAVDWGDAGVRVGDRTPWGTADNVCSVAPGVQSVSTPSHGGIKLSPARNAAVHPAWRNRSGWYEEDCEVAIVGISHADAWLGDQDRAHQVARDYFPDQYEKATGTTLGPGASQARDAAQFTERHRNDQVATSAIGFTDEHGQRMVTVHTMTGGRDGDNDGSTRLFRVSGDEYTSGQPFVVDPERHTEISQPVEDLRVAKDQVRQWSTTLEEAELVNDQAEAEKAREFMARWEGRQREAETKLLSDG